MAPNPDARLIKKILTTAFETRAPKYHHGAPPPEICATLAMGQFTDSDWARPIEEAEQWLCRFEAIISNIEREYIRHG